MSVFIFVVMFRAKENDRLGERPYFHATEEGLPIIALLRFLGAVIAISTECSRLVYR